MKLSASRLSFELSRGLHTCICISLNVNCHGLLAATQRILNIVLYVLIIPVGPWTLGTLPLATWENEI